MNEETVRGHSSHDDYVHAAEQLEREARAQLLPFTVRLGMAWIAAIIITVMMALLVYVVLESVFNFAPIIALGAAMGFQFITIVLCHAYFHGQHKGEGRLNWKFWVAAVASCIALAIAYTRAHMYLEDMELSPVAAAVISFFVSLIEPLISWVTGWMTATAQNAWETPAKIVQRARQHGRAVRGAVRKEGTWQTSIDHARQEIEKLEATKVVDGPSIAQREAKIESIEHWVRMLEQYDPNPIALAYIPPEERLGSRPNR